MNLDGCLARLRRAEEERKALYEELVRWKDSDSYVVTSRVNATYTRHSLVVHLKRPLPAEQISLLAGNCIHSLRSSLDHLVYGLAVHATKADPPPGERTLQFPITDSAEHFEAACDRGQLSGLGPATIAAIESVQPYVRAHAAVPPLLSLLRDFDAASRQGRLVVVSSGHVQSDINEAIRMPPSSSLGIEFNDGPIDDGTEALIVTSGVPRRDLRLDVALTFAVAIMHAPGPSGARVSGLFALLSMIRNEVHFVVTQAVTAAQSGA
jgi:hypothetical protein